MTMHYHGTPISPRSVLETIAGRNFCVSYARPTDIAVCHRLGQSVMLDNGAYSAWRGIVPSIDWDEWARWADLWLAYPTTWAVLPDSIEGGVEENDALLARYAALFPPEQVAPVWHLHEPLERLRELVGTFQRVCFGSSAEYATIGSVAWRRRVSEAFDDLADAGGRVPYVHMLRGMSLVGDLFPFASVDSTDIARNHNRPQNTARAMADRWDGTQCPATWRPIDQLTLTEEVVP